MALTLGSDERVELQRWVRRLKIRAEDAHVTGTGNNRKGSAI
jgi:hypothetical protein